MQKTITPLETVSATDLLTQPDEPLGFTIGTILPHGLFILAGSSKVGKSWLALDMSNCVAGGGTFWSYPVTQGDALYLALEDSNKRLKNRMGKISAVSDTHCPTDIHFVTKAHKLGHGFSEQIRGFLLDYPYTKLIVIDTLQHIRNHGGFTGTYSVDYQDMDSLRKIINGYNLSVLLITHNHKSDEKDPVNKVYGSAGLTGAVDGIFVLEKNKRNSDNARLTIANRDTEGFQFELLFDRLICRWQLVGKICVDTNEEDRLYELLSLLLDGSPVWTGMATQLCNELSKLDPAYDISAIKLSKLLKSRIAFMHNKYGITCRFTRNKNARVIDLSHVKMMINTINRQAGNWQQSVRRAIWIMQVLQN